METVFDAGIGCLVFAGAIRMAVARPLVVCLMGPTGVGKTQVALFLAEKQRFPVDIISVDSVMVYRGLDIGSAKPACDILARIPHRLIDICDPCMPYSAGQFYQDALQEIQSIHRAHRIPLLVGGSMLYFRALQRPFSDLPAANRQIRNEIESIAMLKGWGVLYQRLEKIDPIAARRIHPSDKQRIQRLLEIYYETRLPPTEYMQKQSNQVSPYRFMNLVLAPNHRADLYTTISRRFEHMLDAGLVEEVRALSQRFALTPDLPAMQSIGYRQIMAYLMGQMDYPGMCAASIKATRHLAKRQLTWLRRWDDAHWINNQQSLYQVTQQATDRLRAVLDEEYSLYHGVRIGDKRCKKSDIQ